MFMRYKQLVENSIIDNKDGLGAVPYNMEVDYMGLRIRMNPYIFLNLAAPLRKDQQQSVEYIKDYLKTGGKLGAPFLQIEIPPEWEYGDFEKLAKVTSHEGRNRMIAIKELYGRTSKVETHLFFTGGIRNRHLNQEIIDNLNQKLISETGEIITGPLFIY